MVKLEQIAETALAGEALRLRSLVQDWLVQNPRINNSKPPESNDPDIWAAAAGLVELLALRAGQSPPAWTAKVGAMRKPVYLVKSAGTMPRLRRECEIESPLPLRRRGLYAPAQFLSFA